jgi:hypothetical protein
VKPIVQILGLDHIESTPNPTNQGTDQNPDQHHRGDRPPLLFRLDDGGHYLSGDLR